jgi:hypothetical protein
MGTGITTDQLRAELTVIRSAINSILLTGQSYVRPGFSLSRANLADLQAREQYLAQSITRSEDGMISVGAVGGTVYPDQGWNS